LDRIAEVEEAGARVIPVPLDPEGKLTSLTFGNRADGCLGRIAPTSIPGILERLGLQSVMVEGGSKVLSSFLRSPARSDGTPLVDSIIITVAPMFIGDGVGVVPKVGRSSYSLARR
jgi:2,5-diamino-6-(ribosylamino)-4(3H)-pyrimidinone 5'-phosphate reductase